MMVPPCPTCLRLAPATTIPAKSLLETLVLQLLKAVSKLLSYALKPFYSSRLLTVATFQCPAFLVIHVLVFTCHFLDLSHVPVACLKYGDLEPAHDRWCSKKHINSRYSVFPCHEQTPLTSLEQRVAHDKNTSIRESILMINDWWDKDNSQACRDI